MKAARFATGGLLSGGAGLLIAAAAAAHGARYVVPYRPVVERITVAVPPGHEGLAGCRLAFLSDTHVGPFVSPAQLTVAVNLAVAESPDLVLLGGDYISEAPRFADDAARALAPLARAAPLGAVAVLGNHDLVFGGPEVTRALEDIGIEVLRNRAVAVTTSSGTFWIAGIDDAMVGNPDPVATVAPIPPGAAILALWHEPDGAAEVATVGAFVQLSGHSHGGQVRLPGIGPVALPPGGRRYPIGLNHVDGMPVYTSRGVGIYRPPMRINCPPEITLVTLTAPKPESAVANPTGIR